MAVRTVMRTHPLELGDQVVTLPVGTRLVGMQAQGRDVLLVTLERLEYQNDHDHRRHSVIVLATGEPSLEVDCPPFYMRCLGTAQCDLGYVGVFHVVPDIKQGY